MTFKSNCRGNNGPSARYCGTLSIVVLYRFGICFSYRRSTRGERRARGTRRRDEDEIGCTVCCLHCNRYVYRCKVSVACSRHCTSRCVHAILRSMASGVEDVKKWREGSEEKAVLTFWSIIVECQREKRMNAGSLIWLWSFFLLFCRFLRAALRLKPSQLFAFRLSTFAFLRDMSGRKSV